MGFPPKAVGLLLAVVSCPIGCIQYSSFLWLMWLSIMTPEGKYRQVPLPYSFS